MANEKFGNECLVAHNSYREAHGVEALTLDDELTSEAQHWADILAQKGIFEHSGKNGLGENLAYLSGQKYTGLSVTQMWYDEVEDYSFDTNGSRNGKAIGHFTQVVWKGSKYVGFGIAKSDKGVFICANYRPPGNYTGKFAENVFPKIKPLVLPVKPEEKPETEDGTSEETVVDLPGSESDKLTGDGRLTEIFQENGIWYKKITTTTTKVVKNADGSLQTIIAKSWVIEKLEEDDFDKVNDSDEDTQDEHDGVNVLSKLEEKAFRQQMRRLITKRRKGHHVQWLKYDKDLNEAAKNHAEEMLRQNKEIEYDGGDEVGQSIAEGFPGLKGIA